MNLEKYRALFIEEATDHLAEMTRALSTLERPADRAGAQAAIDTLFRMAHSIKGMAASLDYHSVSTLAHRLEDWLEPARAGGGLCDEAFGALYLAVGALEQMVAEVAETGAAPPERTDVLERLASIAAPGPREGRRKKAAGTPVPSHHVAGTPVPSHHVAGTPVPSHHVAGTPVPSHRLGRGALPSFVRVRAELVDRFLAGIGELMQRQARLEALARRAPAWAEQRAVEEELGGMQQALGELRRRALDIRTTPARRVLERLPRVASELARSLGKRVSVELHGEEVEVDRAVLDHLDEPLLHLVRNAVDHGIELPEARERAGKPPVGTVAIHARRESGRLHLRVEDDGGGLDVELVRRAAVRRGMLPEAVAEDLTLARAAELLFEPGMSTREQVSEVSGRGVGLDAVKRTLESLGGSVTLESRPGAGTRFDVELPSMVALQRMLIVEVRGATLGLATSRIDAVLDVADGELERAGHESFFVHKDEPLPLVDLGERIGFPCVPEGRGAVVVVEVRGFRLGLLVERALQECEIFVRPVPPILSGLEALGGAAILPDGVPVFLLEVGALVEKAL